MKSLNNLDTKHKERVYKKCQEKGLQFLATNTTDDDELDIITFEGESDD